MIDDTENLWVVAFVIKGCGACSLLADTWGSLIKLHDIDVRKIKLGYVDIDEPGVQHDILEKHCGSIKVEYTPTLLFYGKDKSDPTTYEGPISDYTVEKIGSKIVELSDLNGFELKKISSGAQNAPVKPDMIPPPHSPANPERPVFTPPLRPNKQERPAVSKHIEPAYQEVRICDLQKRTCEDKIIPKHIDIKEDMPD